MDKGEISIMLGIIGAGNISEAIIAGILKSKTLDCKNIVVSNYNQSKAEKLSSKYGVTAADNIEVIKKNSIILLAVKPYALINVWSCIKMSLQIKLSCQLLQE